MEELTAQRKRCSLLSVSFCDFWNPEEGVTENTPTDNILLICLFFAWDIRCERIEVKNKVHHPSNIWKNWWQKQWETKTKQNKQANPIARNRASAFKLLQSPGKQRQKSSYQFLEGRISPWTPYRARQSTVGTQFVFAALKPLRSTWSRKGNTCLPMFSLRLNISETANLFCSLHFTKLVTRNQMPSILCTMCSKPGSHSNSFPFYSDECESDDFSGKRCMSLHCL